MGSGQLSGKYSFKWAGQSCKRNTCSYTIRGEGLLRDTDLMFVALSVCAERVGGELKERYNKNCFI